MHHAPHAPIRPLVSNKLRAAVVAGLSGFSTVAVTLTAAAIASFSAPAWAGSLDRIHALAAESSAPEVSSPLTASVDDISRVVATANAVRTSSKTSRATMVDGSSNGVTTKYDKNCLDIAHKNAWDEVTGGKTDHSGYKCFKDGKPIDCSLIREDGETEKVEEEWKELQKLCQNPTVCEYGGSMLPTKDCSCFVAPDCSQKCTSGRGTPKGDGTQDCICESAGCTLNDRASTTVTGDSVLQIDGCANFDTMTVTHTCRPEPSDARRRVTVTINGSTKTITLLGLGKATLKHPNGVCKAVFQVLAHSCSGGDKTDCSAKVRASVYNGGAFMGKINAVLRYRGWLAAGSSASTASEP